jgi:DNA-binding CsgD family transcriptional regulator
LVNKSYRPPRPLQQSAHGALACQFAAAAPSAFRDGSQKRKGSARRNHLERCSPVWPLTILILFQGVCSAVFLGDVVTDLGPQPWSAIFAAKNIAEVAATLGLALGLVFEGFVLLRLLRRQAHLQQSLTAAGMALSDLMQQYFVTWGLTPTEIDVAAFTIKGCSIAEIATLRGSAEGTIKTHLNAIYRKSGVTGRAQLVSVLVEDLLQTPLIGPQARRNAA